MKANVTISSSVAKTTERSAEHALNHIYATEPSELDTELIKAQVALLDGETW